MTRRLVMLVTALLLATAAPAAHDKARQAADASRGALGRLLPDATFTDVAGGKVSLADLKGKPLLLTLIYTSCADVCPTQIQNLYPAVRAAQRALGHDSFNVITIGFDTRADTPERMRTFARQQGVDLPGWKFLSTDESTVERLASAVGFSIFSRAGGFDHLAQVTVVDATGRIYQQVYGAVFDAPLIVEPLKDLVFGRSRAVSSLQDLVDRIRFFCTVYDPGQGRYYFNYSLFIGIAIGMVSFGTVLVLLIREWRRTANVKASNTN